METHEYESGLAGSVGVRSHSSATCTSSEPSAQKATHLRGCLQCPGGLDLRWLNLRQPFILQGEVYDEVEYRMSVVDWKYGNTPF
jgi:hypothetical protein